MKEFGSKVHGFFKFRKKLNVIISILMVIAIYYVLMTGFYLIGLIPLIVMWLTGSEGVEFFDVPGSQEIQRTDISYFTTGDFVDGVKLLIMLVILLSAIVILRKIEKRLP